MPVFLTPRPVYICRRCDLSVARYHAVGNIPQHGHLCRECFLLLSDDMRQHYVEQSHVAL